MAHGGYARRRLEERRPVGRRSKGLGPDKKRKKSKSVSLKNQIRSTERLLRKVKILLVTGAKNDLVLLVVAGQFVLAV